MNDLLVHAWTLGVKPYEWLYHAHSPDSEFDDAKNQWREAIITCQLPKELMPEELSEALSDEAILPKYLQTKTLTRSIRKHLQKISHSESIVAFDIGALLGEALIGTAAQGSAFSVVIRNVRNAGYLVDQIEFLANTRFQEELSLLLEQMNAANKVFSSHEAHARNHARLRAEIIHGNLQISELGRMLFATKDLKDSTTLMKKASTLEQNYSKSYDVFLSYAAADKDLASELYAELSEAGLQVFMDSKRIPAGSVWNTELRNAIRNSKRLLIVVTPRSKDRSWLMYEAGAAWALGLQVIPALSHIEPSELDSMISQFQAKSVVTKKQREQLVRDMCNT